MTADSARSLAAAIAASVVTATLTYFGPTRSAVEHVDEDSRRRHLTACDNAEVNRALIRQAAEGLLEPSPIPEGASPALRQFVELSNAERAKARTVIAANTRTPVECLR